MSGSGGGNPRRGLDGGGVARACLGRILLGWVFFGADLGRVDSGGFGLIVEFGGVFFERGVSVDWAGCWERG